MTRGGVSYVAMAAAGISAAVLAYGVIWSYGEPEALPPAVVSAPAPKDPPPAASAPVPVHDASAMPAPAAATEPAPVAKIDPPRESSKQDAPAKSESAPERLARLAETVPPPPGSRIEKPDGASAPKDRLAADRPVAPMRPTKPEMSIAEVARDHPTVGARPPAPVTQESIKRNTTAASGPTEKAAVRPAASTAAPPRESAPVAPPSARAARLADSPVAPATKESAAETAMPTAASRPVTNPSLSVSRLAATEAPRSEGTALRPAPPERTTMEPRSEQVRSLAPAQREGTRATALSPSAPPPPESPSLKAPLEPAASSATPSSSDAVSPPAQPPERPDASPVVPKTPERAARPHPRMAALPRQTVLEYPPVTIIRGARRPFATRRGPGVEKQRVAALPSGAAAARTATDAPPVLVLRGARRPRYALASAPHPAPEPLLTVIRGARPRPVLLQHYVQPNAMILHIGH
jgi:hypothetical protein